MRDNALNSEDVFLIILILNDKKKKNIIFLKAFIDLCNNAFGRSNERKIKMNLNDFRRSVKNC
jgi:hypothetical protein